jgi:thermitase
MKRVLVFSVGLAMALLVASQALAAPPDPTGAQGYVRGQALVKFKNATPRDVVDQQVERNGARVGDEIRALDVLVLSVPQGQEQKIVTALSRNPNVEYAELNHLGGGAFAPNDPHFGANQWGLENTGQTVAGQTGTVDADVDGPRAWDVTTGRTTAKGPVRVAILDSGIDQDHEDLSSKIVLQKNFTSSNTADVEDRWGHGTHVAGIVGAVTNNNIGVAGGCPECVLMNGKVLNDDLNGAYSWYANGITWAADNGAQVINLSAGGSQPSKTLERAVNYAWSKGAVFVAAAGNSGNQSRLYPAYYTNAIAVAATDNRDQKASFSTYGAWVDVAAPGVNIFSTTPNHPFKNETINGRSKNYDYGSGTSMSSPATAAVAALIWSSEYGTSNSAVRSRLQGTADKIPGTGTYWSAGRVNAANAVGAP